MKKERSDAISYPPRGLSRDEAARYIGISTSKFDKLVHERTMPRPKRIDGRIIWDRISLDAAFTELPEERTNKIDAILSSKMGG